MPRRQDDAQGKLELSFHDRLTPAAPVEAAREGEGRTGAPKRSVAQPKSHLRPRPRRRPTNRPVRGEQDVPSAPDQGDWRIDVTTRRVGRSGVARARAALAAISSHDDQKVDAA